MPWLRGDELDSVMNYGLRRQILRYASAGIGPGARATDPDGPTDAAGLLDTVDRLRAAYPEHVLPYLYNLLGSHDEQRPLTALGGDKGGLALAAALLFTLPGIASIYYGDEVGLSGGKEPENRGGMIWDPARQDQRLLDVYRRLGGLRRAVPALRDGRYERLDAGGRSSHVAAFARVTDDDRLVVVANSANVAQELPGDAVEEWLSGAAQAVASFAYSDEPAVVEGAKVRLPAQSVAVLRPLR
jgi:glycosidase